MTEERQEKNRILAEWVEPGPCTTWNIQPDSDGVYVRSKGGAWWSGNGYHREPADFYTSEDASALLLDKLFKDTRFSMRFMKLYETDPGQWEVRDFDWAKRDADRKTAIAESALRYIESLAAQEKK